MTSTTSYRHTQHAPMCWMLYAICIVFFVVSWFVHGAPVLQWTFPLVGFAMLWLAASFHYLKVEDEGDQLLVRFGPLPTFRRRIRFADIVETEVGRTSIFDGWGIHLSPTGGWVWNLWGRDCVVLRLRRGVLRVGTDDAKRLNEFLSSRIKQFDSK